jgi:hypothetical protein
VDLLFTCLSLRRVHPPSPPSAAFFGLHFSKSYNGVSEQQHITAVALSWQWTLQGLELPSLILTPWSRVLLEKLTDFAASQEIPRIYGTRKFITVLTSARHLSLS